MSKSNSQVRENISSHIKQYLDNTGMSKAAFGKMLGVTATSVTRWINMDCVPEIDLIPDLASLLDVSPTDLLGFESAEHITPSQSKLLKFYASDISFSTLVNRYMKDEEFRKTIDYLAKLK